MFLPMKALFLDFGLAGSAFLLGAMVFTALLAVLTGVVDPLN